jgi:hypothetical protein
MIQLNHCRIIYYNIEINAIEIIRNKVNAFGTLNQTIYLKEQFFIKKYLN